MDRPQRPFFRRGEGRVDEGFAEINFAAVAEVFGQALEQPVEAPGPLPQLESAMTGLVRRIVPRQIRPRGAGPENPQHGVHHATRIRPGPAASVRPPLRTKDRFEHGPLLVSEVHAVEYDGDPNVVHRPRLGFMR